MPDYKEMYLKMFRASEKALDLIVTAQQECEELYTENSPPELRSISLPAENNQNADPQNQALNAVRMVLPDCGRDQ